MNWVQGAASSCLRGPSSTTHWLSSSEWVRVVASSVDNYFDLIPSFEMQEKAEVVSKNAQFCLKVMKRKYLYIKSACATITRSFKLALSTISCSQLKILGVFFSILITSLINALVITSLPKCQTALLLQIRICFCFLLRQTSAKLNH